MDAWKAYKREKAHSFVDRGYSVEWANDPSQWMTVIVPERWYASTPEYRAGIELSLERAPGCLMGGRIRTLTIERRSRDPVGAVLGVEMGTSRILYNYSRGVVDLDLLASELTAGRLLDAVVEEVN